jgi:hypothetical protein
MLQGIVLDRFITFEDIKKETKDQEILTTFLEVNKKDYYTFFEE